MLTKPEKNSFYQQDKVLNPDYFNYTQQIGEFGEKVINEIISKNYKLTTHDPNGPHLYDGEYIKDNKLIRFDVKCKFTTTFGINGYPKQLVMLPERHYNKYLNLNPFFIFYVNPSDYKLYYHKINKNIEVAHDYYRETVGINIDDFVQFGELNITQTNELKEIIKLKHK